MSMAATKKNWEPRQTKTLPVLSGGSNLEVMATTYYKRTVGKKSEFRPQKQPFLRMEGGKSKIRPQKQPFLRMDGGKSKICLSLKKVDSQNKSQT